MAAGGFKEFVAGETLDEDEINDFLMQGVLVFAGTAARGSAITSPVEGQFAFLKDSDALTFYDGSQWAELSTSPGAAVVSGTTGSPTVGTVSSGGTTYNVYSFTGSGSITIDEAGFAELLVISGGGGGGVLGGGGGGAGGHLHISAAYLSAGTQTITVGAGGAGNTENGNAGASGNTGTPSRIADYYVAGGGAGHGARRSTAPTLQNAQAGSNGGSGGGSSGWGHNGPAAAGLGLSPIGNNGGQGLTKDQFAGGGGGGAGAAGGSTSNTTGADGGAGTANSITGTSVTRAGGGGGGGQPGGSGGTGGGGAGAQAANGTSGTANTGGGGGGVYFSGGGYTSGSGGSGIVIVRVAV